MGIPTPRKCGSDFSRTSLWTCGSNFPPTRNLEADRPIFSPVEVWVKLPATGNSEDGADTVLHNSGDRVAEHSDHIRPRVIRFSGSSAECAEFNLGGGRSRKFVFFFLRGIKFNKAGHTRLSISMPSLCCVLSGWRSVVAPCDCFGTRDG